MCSGSGNNSRNGVAVTVDKKRSKSIIEYRTINDRISSVKFNSVTCRMNLVQVSASTSAADEEDIDEFTTH